MIRKIKEIFFLVKCRIERPLNIFYAFLFFVKKIKKINFKSFSPDETEVDVVIPTVSKDIENLKLCILYLRKNLNHKINNVYIISPASIEMTEMCLNLGCILKDENKILGYKASEIEYTYQKIDRSGWIFQQLLKIAASEIVETENYFVIDADTILINKYTCIDKEKRFIFQQSLEWNEEYMKTFKKIFKMDISSKLSFVSHMMIFNKKLVNELIIDIEKIHNKKWDSVILSFINKKSMSYFSEYETYGNWLLKKYPEKIRFIPFYNKSISNFLEYKNDEEFYKKRYNSVSLHKYQS